MGYAAIFFGLAVAAVILGAINAVHKDVKEIKARLKD